MSHNRPAAGWQSNFPSFSSASAGDVQSALCDFVGDVSPEQDRAWRHSIPWLQREVGNLGASVQSAEDHGTVLEYELPMESRRPDVVLLTDAGVAVVELKGKSKPAQADLDQVAAYARDLRCYHRHCEDRPVVAILVPERASGRVGVFGDTHVVGPDALSGLLEELGQNTGVTIPSTSEFVDHAAYRPLPTLVQAARELMEGGDVRRIHKAAAWTDPAVEEICRIIHDAAATKTRRLVLLSGVPGAGKTLVGLRVVHSRFLDDISVVRGDGKPIAPAVFLSGNGPLVEVLQYELKSAGGDGKTFVRGVKDYVRRYSNQRNSIPPEHVLVFDEAQRAWDAARVADGHKTDVATAKSEPELFVEFAERIPDWCVVLGLIGGGQEIHVGEEGGVAQWTDAISRSPQWERWRVHAPPGLSQQLQASLRAEVSLSDHSHLNLDREIRFHLASEIHDYVRGLLHGESSQANLTRAKRLESDGFHLRLTRHLEVAKDYLWSRYRENPSARYGMLASSKDKVLEDHGVPNDFQSTKRVKFGPWYGDDEDQPGSQSCRLLNQCVTEFGAQGLELDGALLGWGTDFMREGGRWTNRLARGYRTKVPLRDPFQLRLNAYRVLLTRARDGVIVFIPRIGILDETEEFLIQSGFESLDSPPA